MRDLKIMGRVLLLGLFVWWTIAWSTAFIIVFWMLIAVLFFLGWKEAKKGTNQRIADAMDELHLNQLKHEALMREIESMEKEDEEEK